MKATEFRHSPEDTLLIQLLEETDAELAAKRNFEHLKRHVRKIWMGSNYSEVRIEFEGYHISVKAPPFFEDPRAYLDAKASFKQQEESELVFVVQEGQRVKDREVISRLLFKLIGER